MGRGVSSALYRTSFMEERGRYPNEGGRRRSIDLPSSIDVEPMVETGLNAYAQMGSWSMTHSM